MMYKPLLIQMNLHYFDEGEKTEKPTQKKKEKSRKEGSVAKSAEIGTAFTFIMVFFALRTFAGGMLNNIIGVFNYGFTMIADINDIYELDFITKYINFMFGKIITIVLPIFAFSMGIGFLTSFVQVGWHPTSKPLKPKFSRLSPLKGVKRLFSMQSLVQLFKSIIKFAIIIYVIYTSIKNELDTIPLLIDMEIMEAVGYIGNLVVDMGIKVGMYFIFVAAADYAYTRFKHSKDLKMTKQEVKEEYKQAEGNPQVKSKIRSKMREVSMRRMMQSVPQADVIITNPTHFAVALKYDKESGGAPVLLAKGADFLAKRIKDLAKEKGIQIVEDKQLARAIYSTVDIGREIPPELYQAVAEILAFVYRLKNKVV